MGTALVVRGSATIVEQPSFGDRVEQLAVQELVPQPRVEGLAPFVLPGLSGQSSQKPARGLPERLYQFGLLARRCMTRISSSCRRTFAARASSPRRSWSISTTRPDRV